jgi:hypothetical protein
VDRTIGLMNRGILRLKTVELSFEREANLTKRTVHDTARARVDTKFQRAACCSNQIERFGRESGFILSTQSKTILPSMIDAD